ncbi:MAG TPA: NAD-dependent succinate-semialdehyde dehydrogenase [Candidatus Bilamarchaeum sp.]|nr:NAD-dependent succinate-semialdehyde dehydrogenase [Candidatus Bilamarchaeum sp.]
MQMLSINPATEEVLAKFDYITEKKAAAETKNARKAFPGWASLAAGERCGYLKKLAGVLKKNKASYGKLISLEMGKPIAQSVSEVEKCAWACEYYAENAEALLADELVKTEGKAYVMFQPLGTILGIMPWNFPFWQVFRFAAATLAAGNTVVVKHSSNVPQCAMAIEGAFREAGFPDHVYKNLPITGQAVKSLVESDLVEGLSLTGSTEAGSKIGELGGRCIKKVVLELGGSDPYVVLDDADLEKCAATAVTARFQNAGQSCIAAKRFIVHSKIAEQFIEEFSGRAKALVMGDPLDGKTTLGPIARGDLRDGLESQLKSAIKDGAKTVCGGRRPEGKGFFFEPTVIRADEKNRTVMEQEFFGPIASVIVAEGDDQLTKIANATKFGLSSSVWGSLPRAESVARKLEAGMVAVNSMARSDPRLPFGGVKMSGVGRELGHFGIYEFTNIKSVVIG